MLSYADFETRIRRVKCGETRSVIHTTTCPCDDSKLFSNVKEGLRYQKFGMKCDGYSNAKIKRALPKAPRKEKPVRLLPITIAPTVNSSPFQDQYEYQYFKVFCDEASESLADKKGIIFWESLVPQACHDEECIKNCVIALVALDPVYRVRLLYLDSEAYFPPIDAADRNRNERDRFAKCTDNFGTKLIRVCIVTTDTTTTRCASTGKQLEEYEAWLRRPRRTYGLP